MSPSSVTISAETRQRISKFLASSAAAVGLIVATIAIGYSSLIKPQFEETYGDAYQAGQIDYLSAKTAEIYVDQQQIRKALRRPPADLDMRLLAQRLDAIEQKQKRIEQAIMDNPIKAIELPLLRNDLNNVKEANAQNISAIKSSVDQVYDLNKWLLGAMALAIVGLAITRLLASKPE